MYQIITLCTLDLLMHSIICQIYLNEAEGQKKLGSGSIYQVSQRGERSKMSGRDFPAGPVVENLPTMRESQVRSLGQENPLEKEMAAHSSTLAWKNPMDREAW